MHADKHTKTSKVYAYTRAWNPYLLKALLIFEQLQVLMEFQMMLLKEAIKGRLHVSKLSKKSKNRRTFVKISFIFNVNTVAQ